jgi:hypothetical protein
MGPGPRGPGPTVSMCDVFDDLVDLLLKPL